MFLDLAPMHAFAAVRAGGLTQAIVLLPDVSPHIGNPVFCKLFSTDATGKTPTGSLHYFFTWSKTPKLTQDIDNHKEEMKTK